MNDQTKVLQAIQQEDLTPIDIQHVTGIPKAKVIVILDELKRARLAIKAVDGSWRA